MQRPSQNVYNYDEVGKSSAVSFGTVISSRQVDIIGKNTGAGAVVGAGAGAGAGSYAGSGSGEAWAIAGGALAGAIIERRQNKQQQIVSELSIRSCWKAVLPLL